MTIPHPGSRERAATAATGPASTGPVTYYDASRTYDPDRIAARERYDDLSMPDHLSRAYAKLRASGECDPARHGAGNTEPLTAAEHLELLATAEYLARSYKPSCEVDQTLRAGASWAQVAEALGTDEAMACVEYRAWADGQHHMLTWTEGRLGMSDAEYAEVLDRGASRSRARRRHMRQRTGCCALTPTRMARALTGCSRARSAPQRRSTRIRRPTTCPTRRCPQQPPTSWTWRPSWRSGSERARQRRP